MLIKFNYVNMYKYLKIISVFYLCFVSIVLIIPLDFYLITDVIEKKNHPSNSTSFFIHFFLFFFLYFLFSFSFSNNYKILYYLILYAVFIELLQIFNSRGFQLLDIFFNILGVIFSFLILCLLNLKLKFFKK